MTQTTSPRPAVPDNMVRTPEARLSYPNLGRARIAPGGGNPKFSCVLIFPKTTDLSTMKKALQAAVRTKWGDQPPRGLDAPFRDGAAKEGMDGYGPDTLFINCSSEQQPQLFDGARRKVEANFFKPGDYVYAVLSAYAWEKMGKKGASFGLRGLQWARTGERLGGGVDTSAMFDQLEQQTPADTAADDLFL